jgi:hypothetical protein
MAEDDLMAKYLREKYMSKSVRSMIGSIEDLGEVWDALETCYERPEKYMSEALKPIIKFRQFKM